MYTYTYMYAYSQTIANADIKKSHFKKIPYVDKDEADEFEKREAVSMTNKLHAFTRIQAKESTHLQQKSKQSTVQYGGQASLARNTFYFCLIKNSNIDQQENKGARSTSVFKKI